LEGVDKQNCWIFDWKFEYLQPEHKMYKLVTENEPKIIHGLISLKKQEDHVFMNLIESLRLISDKTKNILELLLI